jgi:hypothetical protein
VRILTVKRLATDLSARADWSDDILSHLNRLLVGRPDATYAVRSLQVGQFVRVRGSTLGRDAGPVAALTDSTLTFGSPGEPARQLRVIAIDSIWVRGGGHPGTGALVGGLAGIAVGFALANSCGNTFSDLNCKTGALTGATLGGTLLGLAIGAAIPHWRLRFP